MLFAHYTFVLLSLAAVLRARTMNSSVYDPIDQSIFQLSPDSDQAFNLMNILSLANNGGANTGEVLRIATQVVPEDVESNYDAFNAVAEAINALAESIDPVVDPVGARENFFHASTYFRSAAFFLVGNQSDPRLISLWNQQLTAFNNAIALLKPVPGETFTVRAENSSIGPYNVPGYFYKANSSNSTRLPTFIMITGYDGSQQELYHATCVQVLLRGMNCATYEGPGQPAPRRYQNLGFIPDWWTANTPVVDYVVSRPDVDPSKIVLVGESFGATLAPLAVSQDPRIAALVVFDGLVSLQQDLLEQFPSTLDSLFKNNQSAEFDEALISFATNKSIPLSSRWIIEQGLWAFDTQSPFDWFTRLGGISTTPATVAGIGNRPVYIAKGQDDRSLLNQPNLAYDQFVSHRPNGANLTYFHKFLIELGAGEHCSIGAESQLWTNILGWLSGVWGGFKFGNNALGVD